MENDAFQDVTQAFLEVGGLFDRAEAALKRALEASPQNRGTLSTLAQIYRGKGDFSAAAEAYRQLLKLDPGDYKSAYLYAVLSGTALPVTEPVAYPWPAPFVHVTEFLPHQLHQECLEYILEQQDKLLPSETIAGLERKVRTSHVLAGDDVKAIREQFLPHLEAHFPAFLPRLQIPPFDVTKIEGEITVHGDGEFYKVHQDTDDKIIHTRRLSYVYYLYRQPKRFTGGDLLLYDTNLQDNVYSPSFTCVQPLDNSIVFFPSNYFHQVTSVRCETADYRDGRFTLNGWLHTGKTNTQPRGLNVS